MQLNTPAPWRPVPIAPGIVQLALSSRPAGQGVTVFVYVLLYGDETALVDTGWPSEDSYQQLVTQLAAIGRTPADLTAIVATHVHPDHAGQARRLKAASNAPIIYPVAECDMIALDDASRARRNAEQTALLIRHGAPEDEATGLRYLGDVAPDIVVAPGETLRLAGRDWRVIGAPGHTPGQIALFCDADGVLLSGDAVIPGIVTTLAAPDDRQRDVLADHLTTLDALAALPARLTLPGHVRVVDDLAHEVAAARRIAARWLRQFADRLTDEPQTAYAIGRARYAKPTRGWDVREFGSRVLFLETAAYLLHLAYTGHARVEETDRDLRFVRA